ncbi:hypothetical protein D3C87_1339950 [compost metagenome]
MAVHRAPTDGRRPVVDVAQLGQAEAGRPAGLARRRIDAADIVIAAHVDIAAQKGGRRRQGNAQQCAIRIRRTHAERRAASERIEDIHGIAAGHGQLAARNGRRAQIAIRRERLRPARLAVALAERRHGRGGHIFGAAALHRRGGLLADIHEAVGSHHGTADETARGSGAQPGPAPREAAAVEGDRHQARMRGIAIHAFPVARAGQGLQRAHAAGERRDSNLVIHAFRLVEAHCRGQGQFDLARVHARCQARQRLERQQPAAIGLLLAVGHLQHASRAAGRLFMRLGTRIGHAVGQAHGHADVIAGGAGLGRAAAAHCRQGHAGFFLQARRHANGTAGTAATGGQGSHDSQRQCGGLPQRRE